MDEEERLIRAMERKANLAFEQKRKEALAKYKGPAQFRLAESEKKPSQPREAPVFTSPRFANGADLDGNSAEAEARRRQREEEERRRREAETVGQGNLAAYLEREAEKEREFRMKREEEERRKREELQSMGSSLAEYEARLQQQEREARLRREEEDRRRREEIAAQEAKLRAYKEKQEEEEREFRRRREEEERRRREQIEAMERADAERRAMLAARAREEQEERRRAAAGAAAANVVCCSSCNSELKPEQVVNVKGTNYCYRCSLAASADRCAGCNKPILSGTMLKAGAKKFHPDCLKCEKCQAQLTDGYRVRRNKMLCIPCSQTSL